MKLLFDQNLSPVLVARLADVYPQSRHVRDAGLERASDDEVWRLALDQGLAIVTKDSDFQERRQFAITAPDIVWIRRAIARPTRLRPCCVRRLAASRRSSTMAPPAF